MNKPHFYVDDNRELELDGLKFKVLSDSREDLLPPTRDMSEEIPGRDGEIDFGTEFKPRPLELHLAIELGNKTKEEVKRTVAKHFNPTMGIKTLEFADEPNRYYRIKYSGRTGSYGNYPSWLEFTVPFKMPDPYIYSSVEHASSISGSCLVLNQGTVDTPILVVIEGESVSPAITVSSEAYGLQKMQWNETVESGKELIINTGDMIVIYDGGNGAAHFDGDFRSMVIPPGGAYVSASGGGTVQVKWYDKWI